MLKSIARPYKAGSIIYFSGDKSEDVFLLQTGSVRLTSTALDGSDTEIIENINKGEFFGVKSALGYFPREETAQAMSDCVILILSVESFESLCVKNISLTLRMLKIFSSQLRKVHKVVKQQLGEDSEFDQDLEFLKVGEYYYKQDKNDRALYIFNKFIEKHPNSKFINRVKALLDNLKQDLPYPVEIHTLEDIMNMSPEEQKKILYDTTFEPVGNFSSFTEVKEPEPPESQVSQLYYMALNYFSQNNLDEAITNFQNIMNIKSFSNSSDVDFIEKSNFELIRCFMKKNNFDKAFELSTFFLKKYPNSDSIKQVMIMIGSIYEARKNIPQAIIVYQKVVTMQPKDKNTAFATQKIEQLRRGT